MKPINKKIHRKKFYGPKFLIAGIVVGIVLATVGSVAALNGWFTSNNVPSDTLTRGLVGYWGMDEGSGTAAYDASNNNNIGILSGPSWGGSTTTCKIGGCLTFDGTNDYVDVGNVGNVQSVEFWINDANATDGVLELINNSTYISIASSAITATGFTSATKYINGSSASASLASGWNHVVITDTAAVAAASFLIGEANTDYTSGIIDEVRIYNRALSAEEVRYHYNRGGPVGQWSFNEGSGSVAYDATESNNDGTLQLAPAGNTATSSAWVAGKSGSALSFDGVDDYVGKDSGVSGIGGQNQITYEAWIKRGGTGTGDAIYGLGDVSLYKYQALSIQSDNTIRADFGNDANNNYRVLTTTNTLTDTTNWHHIAVTYNAGTINIYIDGVSWLGSYMGTWTGAVVTETTYLRIGALWNGANVQPFNGLIDDVRIYNYARTAEEIRLDYNAGFAVYIGPTSVSCNRNPGSCMTNGLVGYLPMDEGSGGTAYDISGNARNGALNGPAWTRGKVGGSLSFDGSNDRIPMSGTETNVLYGWTQGAIELWINPGEFIATREIWSKNGVIDSGLYVNSTGGQLQFHLGFTSGAVNLNSNSNLSLNNWYHIVTTFDSSGMKFYINGVLDNSNANTGVTESNATYQFALGSSGTEARFFKGIYDEARVYNRALSAEEVRYHYNRGGPVAQWSFNEGSGSVAYDATESNNDGTLQLAPAGNTATSSAWVAGKSGSALSFDGVDDYVDAGNVSSNARTVSFWLKRGDTSNKDVIDLGTPEIKITSNAITSTGLTSPTYYIDGIQGATSIANANQWYHITITDTADISASNVDIGKASSNYFLGLIDDVRVYNYARTAEEIRLDYNAGFAVRVGTGPSGGACPQDPGSCMTQGLVGYWNMDEGSGGTVYDSSNYANNGSTSGGPTWTKGKLGGALSFDGTDDDVNAGSGASLNLTGNQMTLAAWVKPETMTGGLLVRSFITKGTYDYALQVNRDLSGLNFSVKVGTSYNATYSTTLTSGQWYHIVGVYDGANVLIYVNGSKTTGSAVTGNMDDSSAQNLWMGRDGGVGGSRYVQSLIDEVRVYNRALSAEEVRYHYNRGGPIGYWKFDEGEGRTAYDSTDNNNDGTLVLAGSATSSAWVAGKYGSALSFDGVDDYVSVADTTGSALDISSSIGWGAWVYPRSFPTSDTATIVTKSAAYYMSVNTSGQVQAYLDGTANQGYHAMNTALTLNKWNYIFLTYDGSSVKLYLNGVLDKTVADSGSISTNNWIVGIGAEQGAGAASRFFNGLIDDVRVYNYARTQEQILQDYNGGVGAHFK